MRGDTARQRREVAPRRARGVRGLTLVVLLTFALSLHLLMLASHPGHAGLGEVLGVAPPATASAEVHPEGPQGGHGSSDALVSACLTVLAIGVAFARPLRASLAHLDTAATVRWRPVSLAMSPPRAPPPRTPVTDRVVLVR